MKNEKLKKGIVALIYTGLITSLLTCSNGCLVNKRNRNITLEDSVNNKRGIRIHKIDRNKNQIPEEIRYYKKQNGVWDLKYTEYDWNEDGNINLVTFYKNNREIGFMLNNYKKKIE